MRPAGADINIDGTRRLQHASRCFQMPSICLEIKMPFGIREAIDNMDEVKKMRDIKERWK